MNHVNFFAGNFNTLRHAVKSSETRNITHEEIPVSKWV